MTDRLDRQSPTPFYHQLAALLRRDIRERLAEGAGALPLPSESELMRRFRVSRATVRAAVGLLERERLVYRERGRGSFAAAPRVEQELTDLVSTTEDMRRRGWDLVTRVLSIERLIPPPAVAGALELPDRAEAYRLRRLRCIGGEPLSLQTAWLPVARFADIEQHDLSASLYRLCEDVYGVRLWTARETLRARIATREETRLLQLPPHSALLCAERTTYSAAGEVVEYLDAAWRGDRYDFRVTLTRPRSAEIDAPHAPPPPASENVRGDR